MKRRATTGFSLIELMVVIAIASVLAGIAIPMTINAVKSYRLTAAASAATGAIQSTRYAAIMQGCPYQVTFTPATNSYQVYSMPSCTKSALGPVIPISRLGDVTISRTVTYQFNPGGTVTEIPTTGNMIFSITNAIGGSKTITVSGVGNVSVATP